MSRHQVRPCLVAVSFAAIVLSSDFVHAQRKDDFGEFIRDQTLKVSSPVGIGVGEQVSGNQTNIRDYIQIGADRPATLVRRGASPLERKYSGGTVITLVAPHRIMASRRPDGLYIGHEFLMKPDDREKPLSEYRKNGRTENEPRIRMTCLGFHSDSVEIKVNGAKTRCTFTIPISDQRPGTTEVTVLWKIEYLLETVSLVEQATSREPLIQDQELRTLGNIAYFSDDDEAGGSTDDDINVGTGRPYLPEAQWQWGGVWVPERSPVRIEVGTDGFVTKTPKIDERYIVHSYVGRGSAKSSGPDFEPTDVFNVDGFEMNGPTELIFRWRKQLLVKLGPMLDDTARPFPYVKIDHDFAHRPNIAPSEGDWISPYAKLSQHDMPERWFNHGAALYIAAPEFPGEGMRLRGWQSAGGHFASPEGRIPSQQLQERQDVELRSVRRAFVNRQLENVVDSTPVEGTSWGLQIPSLTRPTFVTWNYGDVVFKFDIPIGEALDPRSLNESANRPDDEQQLVITDWEGNVVSRDAMPNDIDLNQDPKITVIESPPGSVEEDTVQWDDVGKRLWPLRTGRFLVEFRTRDPERSVFVEVVSGFYGEPVPNSMSQAVAESDRTVPGITVEEEAFRPAGLPQHDQTVRILYSKQHYRKLLNDLNERIFQVQFRLFGPTAGLNDPQPLNRKVALEQGLETRPTLHPNRTFTTNGDIELLEDVEHSSIRQAKLLSQTPQFRLMPFRKGTTEDGLNDIGRHAFVLNASNLQNQPQNADREELKRLEAKAAEIRLAMSEDKRGARVGILERLMPGMSRQWNRRFRDAHYRHIAGTPPVELNRHADDEFHPLRLAWFRADSYSEGEKPQVRDGAAEVTGGRFSNGIAGRSVIVFSKSSDSNPASFPAKGDLSREEIFVRVVETRYLEGGDGWDDNRPKMVGVELDIPVGEPLNSELDLAAKGTGWLYRDDQKQLHNPDIYDRENVSGPLIPVNTRPVTPEQSTEIERKLFGASEGPRDYSNELVVVWYENLTKQADVGIPQKMNEPDIDWPWAPVLYPSTRIHWPANNPNLIVMASRLGSAGLTEAGDPQLQFETPRFSKVRIYHQPDPESAGFNPNEEHAIVADSLFQDVAGQPGKVKVRSGTNPPPAAFALRTDLNRRGIPDHTSEPFVLVEYFDASVNEHRMRVYAIKAENNHYKFRYPIRVGEPVAAPYPLNSVIGLANLNDTGRGTRRPVNAQTIDGTFFVNGQPQATYWFDPPGTAWVISGPTPATPEPHFLGHFYYPMRDSFWHPNDSVAPGARLVWLRDVVTSNGRQPFGGGPGPVRFDTAWPETVPILKAGETLTYAGGEYKADHPTTIQKDGRIIETPGLPGVIGWAAGQLLFDSQNASMKEDHSNAARYTARLLNPLQELHVPLAFDRMKNVQGFAVTSSKIQVDGLLWTFPELPASLQRRVTFDPQGQTPDGNDGFITGRLVIRGYVSGRTLGDSDLTADPDPVYLVEPNILTASERDRIASLFDSPDWRAAVAGLFKLSRDPEKIGAAGGQTPYLAGLTTGAAIRNAMEAVDLKPIDSVYLDANGRRPAPAFGPGLALLPNAAAMDPRSGFKEGYVTLVENAHPMNPDLSPVTIHVVKVSAEHRYRGSIKTILSPNAFDERITLRHTGDFGANGDGLTFEWWFRESASDAATHPLPGENGAKWQPLPGQTGNEVVLEGNPTLLLGDFLFFSRYRHANDPAFGRNVFQPFPWEWAGAGNSPQLTASGGRRYLPQLAMGWIKRVLDAINPYEARFTEFRDHESPATYASMIQQAGGPFVGPVALNPDKNVVENSGLIQIYQTLLERARKLSIDATQPTATDPIFQALLLAATRSSDLYMLLANEAYADAQDPTIGIGTRHTEYGNLAPTLFAFQNQEASLLHEELALLRGVDFPKGNPVQSRLFWNFVKGQGEAAYATNYAIKDVNDDGFINERDARLMYPQGHGDAWGHYLSAARSQYALLRHPVFQWRARPELYNLLDIVLKVDYLDEVKFVRTAAARARTGAEIVDLTHRLAWTESGQSGAELIDRESSRAWGVAGWSRRAGQGALFDWAVSNAMLPERAAGEENLAKIDRQSVHELREISVNHSLIQRKLDQANDGLNPLGLSPDAVAFDIDPVRVDRTSSHPATHFEQTWEHATRAAANAVAAWDYANESGHRLRQVGERVDETRKLAVDQDLAWRNRLIEVFGLPYDGTIGPGKAYPAGYAGPDILLYFYVDQAQLLAEDLPQVDTAADTNFVNAYGDFAQYYNDNIADLKDHPLGRKIPGLSPLDKDSPPDISSLFGGKQTVALKLPYVQRPAAIFAAPKNWGRRKANGRLQNIYARLMLAEFELLRKLAEYDGYASGLVDLKDSLDRKRDYQKSVTREKLALSQTKRAFQGASTISNTIAETADTTATATETIIEGGVQGIPGVVGFSNDVGAPIRLAVKTTGGVLSTSMRIVKMTANIAKGASDLGIYLTELSEEVIDLEREESGEIAAMAKEFLAEFDQEPELRLDIYEKLKQIEQLANQYLATLQEGQRLLDEREVFNRRIAAGTQESRYQDLTLRLSRNDAMQKYRSSFDLAARYVYLAARAYDYETSLPESHPASASQLLDELIRTRNPGLWENGLPRIGQGGLAGILARLKDNFDVLNGQLGFNNPQTQTGRFSLRRELFRIAEGEVGNAQWQQKLQESYVEDIRDLPEFRLHCRPFAASAAGAQPGLVIEFGTMIQEGRNFFGQPVGPGDHLFDPSQFATKIRSVGVWFVDYPATRVAGTPHVYLVPVGTDVTRYPYSETLEEHTWNVVDQRIPVPHRIGLGDLSNRNWSPALSFSGAQMDGSRRFSRFRAYPDKGELQIDSEMTWNSRLVGRSVWNTRWLLIIPGSGLHHDANEGLRSLNAEDNSGVSDIKLLFKTYSHSGN
tara:strand:- start:105700 stop:114426 length:8727 start_codon:yes stop_codon:yes gene_type:complete